MNKVRGFFNADKEMKGKKQKKKEDQRKNDMKLGEVLAKGIYFSQSHVLAFSLSGALRCISKYLNCCTEAVKIIAMVRSC